MQEVLRRLREESKLDLNMRIGLASGPIMAGVIGRQKFSYDIWGDAVNLAARLENLSIPGRIHVCPRCRAELDKTFVFESRGIVEIKGVGQQETWFLLARRDGMSDAETEAAAE
jgi:adenylate cyclase